MTEAIARNSTVPIVPAITAAAYHGKPAMDVRAIGRDHDVHFVLIGNVGRSDGHPVVSASLHETESGRTVWSQQYDRADSLGALDGIVQGIANGFDQATIDAEAARAAREHPDDLDKRDLMFAALATPLQQITRQAYLARLSLIDRALALDPNYVWALQKDGRFRADLVFNGFSPDPSADLARALRSVDQALLLAPNEYGTLREKSRVLRAQGDLDGAAVVIRKLIEMKGPSESYRYYDLGWILLAQGHSREALDNFLAAKRLAATDTVFIQQTLDANLAIALVANDRFAEAIPQARLAIAGFAPDNPSSRNPLVGADRRRKSQWSGFTSAGRPREVPRYAAYVAQYRSGPGVSILRRQPKTARRLAPRRDARGIAAPARRRLDAIWTGIASLRSQ